MAVVTDFSAVPLAGIPASFQVQFADLSTGSPDNWWWEFGDGETSTDQHPLHTYVGEFGDKFTVTLRAFKSSGGEIDYGALSMHTYDTTIGGTFGSNAAAYADILLRSPFRWYGPWPLEATWFSDGVGTPGTPLYKYGLNVPQATLNLNDSGGGPSNHRVVYNQSSEVSIYDGVIDPNIGGGSFTSGGPTGQFTDVTGSDGANFILNPRKNLVTILPPQEAFKRSGVACHARIKEIPTAAADDTDTETKVDYILFGSPPVAEFSASPLSGPGASLQVQFTNLSTPAFGLPTTYSWKKRINGSGDAFVEFSTEENPLASFGKS